MSVSLHRVGQANAARARVDEACAAARAVQPAWAQRSIADRARVAGRLRSFLVERAGTLAEAIELPQRRCRAESVSAELIPLADACRHLQRDAATVLATRRPGRRGRPGWLGGSHLEVERVPHGVVLILGPANYPLFLPGVQAMQALVAGNAVLWKPGAGGGPVAHVLAEALADSGLPPGLLHVLDESRETGEAAVDAAIDRVVLTGSASTGAAVTERLAGRPTSTTMELSGCDAAVVRADADLDLAAAAIAFGLVWNGGFSCISPRRLLVQRDVVDALEGRLSERLHGAAPVPLEPPADRGWLPAIRDAQQRGARLVAGAWPEPGRVVPIVLADVPADSPLHREDFPYPSAVLETFATADDAVERVSATDYALGAAIFGAPAPATALARRMPVGVVVINDMIAPTADPRAPFGGARGSGHGTTRGDEGLLEMTRPRTILRRRGRFRPHFEPLGPEQAKLLDAFLEASHASSRSRRIRARWRSIATMIRIGRQGKNRDE